MFALIRPFCARILGCLLLLLLASAIQLMLPYGVKILFDQMFHSESAHLLHLVAGALLGLFVLRSLFGFFGQFYLQTTGDEIVVHLRRCVFEHLHTLGLGYHLRQQIGDLLSRLSNDVTAIRSVATNTVIAFVISSFQLLGAAAVMMMMNWRLGLIMLIACPLTTIVSRSFAPAFKRLSARMQDELALSTSVVQESLAGIEVVNSYARAPHEGGRYGRALAGYLRAAYATRKSDAVFNAVISFLTSSVTIAIFWFGGLEVLEGRLSAGTLVAFLLYSQNVTQGISSLAQQYSSFNQAVGSSRRVFEILAVAPEITDCQDAVDLAAGPATVAFEEVSFAYFGRERVLQGINLRVDAGETVAFVGPSGSGKSTLLKLVPRFYDVTSGAVMINGRDVREYTLKSLREAVAIVSQDTFLFADSIRENIRYGRLGASDAEVEAAARAAKAHWFIERLPQGYDTYIGERGLSLSGGQRQRISIARALLKDAPILVLDEATSAVDSASETLIQGAIERLRINRTTFIIAHRPTTIRNADQIVLLADGAIVGCGTHAELIADSALYRNLFGERQAVCA